MQGLNATPGDGSMALAWNVPPDIGGRPITDYVVRYRLTGETEWTIFSHGVSTTTGATVTGLTNALSYDFQVAAINASGEGAAATATDTPAVPLMPVEILAFDADNKSAGGSSTTFTDVSVATGTVLLGIVNGNFGAATAVAIGGVAAVKVGNIYSGNHDRSLWIAVGRAMCIGLSAV